MSLDTLHLFITHNNKLTNKLDKYTDTSNQLYYYISNNALAYLANNVSYDGGKDEYDCATNDYENEDEYMSYCDANKGWY